MKSALPKSIFSLTLQLLFFSSFMTVNASELEVPECRLVKSWGKHERYDCQSEGKNFNVLKLRGSFQEGVTAHATLFTNEVLQGPLKEVIQELRAAQGEGSLAARNLKAAIFQCYSGRIKDSVSQEFYDSANAFAQRMKRLVGSSSPYSEADFRDAIYGIEMSIAFEGLFRRLEQDKIGTIAELATTCGIQLSFDLVDEVMSGISEMGKMKLGCIGFTAPGNFTTESGLMHARNFDGNLVSTWNKNPTLFLVEEPGKYKYAAVASAGVIYAGGISGMNEHGISVSLHEMSTTNYRTFHRNRSADLAPFVQTRILREARTLDEAIQIVKNSKHFGGWTIFVSDSKTDETASIEFSGDRVQVARRRAQDSMGQSNHFLGSQMQDQAFTYSYGKRLESRSRLAVVERELRKSVGSINLDWMIDHLAGHEDGYEGFRAFGRTSVKAYNLMSTIAIPRTNEFWFSIGERMPAAHSTFVGAQIDFRNMNFEMLGAKRTQQFNHIPNWDKSLEAYVNARLAYEAKLKPLALSRLDEALKLAAMDGIDESTYRYVRARLLLEMGRNKEALSEFNHLWSIRTQLHRHKVALISLYSTAAIRGLPASPQQALLPTVTERVNLAISILKSTNQVDAHFDLDKKIELANQIRKNKAFKLEKIDFVTVE